ncbi:glycoside hydrolase family 97 protein [Cellvibrio japonicus]|uniref:Alpha-glucosidase, putative, adg97A n=1 Tax=Cellvibrio japonicus (strain Ueda107) TaxID=498211 RepID=B3PKR0_CELJU|nr:glycoside hydrolase family 97 protein [Cellvibrio japonicus]ACE84509.1 alpha-glucosidase, putative, adg97A [Cellvibrio japonicus Ueda107]
MMQRIHRLWGLVGVLMLLPVLAACSVNLPAPLTSPDRQLQVRVYLTPDNRLAYDIHRQGQAVILASDLGLQLQEADFSRDLSIVDVSAVTPVSDRYEMLVGKQRWIDYQANEQTLTLVNAQQQRLAVTFRVSDDGVAFRYRVDFPGQKHFLKELTSFQFAPDSKAWLQPMSVAQTGWSNTNPSYEEHYQMGIPVGTASTLGAGWVFPGLFQTGKHWVLISEVGMDGSWHGSRLHDQSPGGKYTLDIPQAAEVFTDGALLAHTQDALVSPWRLLAIGDLAQVIDSTLGTDLAAPAVNFPRDLLKPGHASWSWALLKDDFTVFEVQKTFIDYAADMHWDYTLVDADWDRKIGYEKLQQLVDYAATKNIGILVWYNSAGAWNQTPYTPKSQLLTHAQREKEFARLRQIGVKGVKIDFFGGDGQSMMAYYVDILNDAAAHGLLVNFHGATLPRGWQRTYPNLMTVEAIRGFEFTTFTQADEDAVVTQVAIAPFVRNVFDPMDFTPMVFGDIPNIQRRTHNSFELAQSVLFLSGIQHFAEIPEGMASVPAYVKHFLQTLPVQWDRSRFVDGFPGKYVVIARQAGDTWYIAGVNAEAESKTLTLDLSFADGKQGVLIGSGDSERRFVQSAVDSRKPLTITLKPAAGFVIRLQ